MTTINSIQEAVTEIQHQLSQRDFYMHNYRLLDSVQNYLDNCPEEESFDEAEQIFNFLAYDLKWEGREDELFPMEL
jgi:hypothetical protein